MMNIRDRILARPDLALMRGARDITGLAAALNAEGLIASQSRFITSRAVITRCPDGRAIMAQLKEARADEAIDCALTFLAQESGLDIGDPDAQNLIAWLVASGTLSQVQGDQLKALALGPVVVTQSEVAAAMYNPDGSEK